MTTFYLIRHATNDYLPHTLVGRKPGVRLNDAGRREAESLANALAAEGIQNVFSSPMERCRETAEPLAWKLKLEVRVMEALTEVDFGDWTGRKIAELNSQDAWKQWNTFRSGARAPNGESMWEVQMRMVGALENLRRDFAGQRVALFSHGDPLRASIIYFLGMPLEFIRRIELSTASVSVLAFTEWDVQVLQLGCRYGPGEGKGIAN